MANRNPRGAATTHIDKPSTASSCEQFSSRIMDGVPLANAVPQYATSWEKVA
jgi:polyphosphate kinase 2 (PPK2 family)